MKKLITFILLFTTILFSYGQIENTKEIFEKDIKDYSDASNNKDWDKMTSKIYPKFFDIVSKKQMISLLDMLSKSGMSFEDNFKQVDSISDIVKSGREKYCRVFYSGILKLKISDDFQLVSMDQIKNQFEESYGKGNVVYNDEEKLFTMVTHECMIAIAYKKSNDWKYIQYKKDNQYIPQLIPKDIQTKLKL